MEKYDTFLILTTGRFTENDLLLARKVKSIAKVFRFSTHQDRPGRPDKERKKTAFNEELTLKEIQEDCLKNLKKICDGDEIVFLISNHTSGLNHIITSFFFTTYVMVKYSTRRSFDSIYCRLKNDRSEKPVLSLFVSIHYSCIEKRNNAAIKL